MHTWRNRDAGPADTYITITFDPFDVENYFDYVEVYDGNTTSQLIGDLDTSRPVKDTFESTSNQMLVYFHTDNMVTDKGWSAMWNAKKNTPAVNQVGTNGEMSSPNYPGEYDRFLEQMYYATSPENTSSYLLYIEGSSTDDLIRIICFR
ncbi:CUB domain protein [Ancylostoma caninum]|uniref:CUB domain protein n=1 Tax=Ancylostoma caninum TaxID=29170 RepID=A0A368FGF3_ANCCA|nr:CUB domain protein [Ancylostoma caninum]